MSESALVVADRVGVSRAFLEPSDLSITRRWNGGAELSCKIPVDDENAGELAIASRVVKWYRDGVLCFHGRIHEPLTSDQDNVTVIARDPWFDFAWRRVRGIDDVVTGNFQPLVYADVDAGAIAWNVLQSTASLVYAGGTISGLLRVNAGVIEPSVPRDRTYDQGKRIDEIIAELAEVSDGFGFTFDPLDGVPGKWATFNIYFPASRDDQPDVKFEYGEGTIANLEGFTEEITLPHNVVTAVGGGNPADTPFYGRSLGPLSIATYDCFEDYISRPDILYSGASFVPLDDAAFGAWYGDPPASYTLKPGADAPLLFEDFNVGDLVRLAIRKGRVDVAGSFRVAEATLSRSNDGREQLTSIVLSDPKINRVPRRPEDRLFSLLEAAARRLRVLEQAS